jgi:hypothetical protein
MQLINARLQGAIQTQNEFLDYVTAIDDYGQMYTVWRNRGGFGHLGNGSIVQLQLAPNGKIEIIDSHSLQLPFEAESKLRKQLSQSPMGFRVDGNSPALDPEITNYIGRLGDLHAQCLETVTSLKLQASEVENVASILFQKACQHQQFN